MNNEITNIDIWSAVIALNPSIAYSNSNDVWIVQYPAGGTTRLAATDHVLMTALIKWYTDLLQGGILTNG